MEKMKINDFLKNVKTLAITGHVRPDGDCAGSVLGLYNYVRNNYPDIDVDVYLQKPTDKLSFLAGFDCIQTDCTQDKNHDLMICLDAGSFDRLGDAEKYFKSAAHTINIDHHISNTEYADENYVYGSLSSACEALYGFLEPDKINRDIAIALYTGILYDTGVFKYSATSPQTMRIVADLMEFGIPAEFIIDESFYAKTYNENRIFGYAVLNSKLVSDGKMIYSYVSRKKIEEYNVTSKDLEGIVSQLRLTRGVKCAVFLHEMDQDEFKVSLRSTGDCDVNKVAVTFGGGGHKNASGCTLKGSLEECLARLLEEAEKAL